MWFLTHTNEQLNYCDVYYLLSLPTKPSHDARQRVRPMAASKLANALLQLANSTDVPSIATWDCSSKPTQSEFSALLDRELSFAYIGGV